jgi:hypothetical protein
MTEMGNWDEDLEVTKCILYNDRSGISERDLEVILF